MQTAVEYLISELSKPYGDKFINEIFEQAKEIEKQNIIDSFEIGKSNGYELGRYNNYCNIDNGIEYYNETYGSKLSDEITNCDIQTEISDEEIEEAADKYSDSYECPSKIKLCKHDIKAAFVNSIGWYREQLKKKI